MQNKKVESDEIRIKEDEISKKFENICGNHMKYIILYFFIIIAAYYISTYQYQLMIIQGQSMHPTYHNLQIVILDKRDKDFQAGDVIAFRCGALQAILVKRIVAVPGDTVHIMDGTLYVNGQSDAEVLYKECLTYAGIAENKLTLSKDEYFVLGDQPESSKDSRYTEIGCVKESSIAGKVLPNLDIKEK